MQNNKDLQTRSWTYHYIYNSHPVTYTQDTMVSSNENTQKYGVYSESQRSCLISNTINCYSLSRFEWGTFRSWSRWHTNMPLYFHKNLVSMTFLAKHIGKRKQDFSQQEHEIIAIFSITPRSRISQNNLQILWILNSVGSWIAALVS